ncbi:MAG: tyrosine recombinase, partial [Ignavibacteriales bacterium]|nr:tyrosine recombinase [Ignavibacteriales bacterium]
MAPAADVAIVVENYLEKLEAIDRAAPRTVVAYRKDLSQFLDFCREREKTDLATISHRDIKRFLVYLNALGMGASSVARKLAALRGLFSYAVKNDLIEDNPATRLRNPKFRRKLPDIITAQDYDAVIADIE